MSMEAAAKHTSELQGGASSKEHELFNLPLAGTTCYRCGGKVMYLTSAILSWELPGNGGLRKPFKIKTHKMCNAFQR